MLCIAISEEDTKIFDNLDLGFEAERKGLAGKEILIYWIEYARAKGHESLQVFSPVRAVRMNEELDLFKMYGVKVVYQKLSSLPEGLKTFDGIGVFLDDGSYRKINDFDDLLKFEQELLENPLEYSSDLGYGNNKNIRIGKDVYVHPTAKLIGNVIIGDNCRIERDTIIENSVINKYCFIKDGSEIKDSHIGINTSFVKDFYINKKAVFKSGIYDMGLKKSFPFNGTI